MRKPRKSAKPPEASTAPWNAPAPPALAPVSPKPDVFAVLRPRLVKALVGFSAELPKDWHEGDLVRCVRPPRDQFPVPELVLFALRNVMRCQHSGPGEKVRWSVYCTFNGALVAFELQKFGFTINATKGAEVDAARLCGHQRVEHCAGLKRSAKLAFSDKTLHHHRDRAAGSYSLLGSGCARAHSRKVACKSNGVVASRCLSVDAGDCRQ